MKLFSVFILLLVTASCVYVSENKAPVSHCTNDWFSLVEEAVGITDGKGHGPDLGSLEWRSVVEFKLGIRGESSNPPLDSDHWCSFIDKNFIKGTSKNALFRDSGLLFFASRHFSPR